MKFKELCKRLEENIEEKKIYFNHLEAEEFLQPFFKKGILNFDDYAGGAVISYLQRLLNKNSNLKDNIINIINHNLDKKDLYLSYSNYMALIDFISSLALKDIEGGIHYASLFEMSNSIKLCKKLLRQDISSARLLCKDCIAALIRYSQITQSDIDKNTLKPKYNLEIYDIKQIFLESPFKENLYKALQCSAIYEFLINQYSEIYKEFDCKDLSIFQRQCIDFKENGEFNYSEFDIRNIIIDCLSISIERNHSIKNIKFLLKSKIKMFNKLGLYYISKDLNKYKDLFVKYFNSLDEQNLHFVIYEIMTILENIDDDIAEQIINKLKNFSNKTRYRLLHSIKINPNRSTTYLNNLFIEFESLKQLFDGEEIKNPKFLFKIEISQPKQKSPISKEKFEIKTIKEQIEYINNYKEPKQYYDADGFLITEAKLNDIFKDVLSTNVNKYLQSDALLSLKKDMFMCTVFEVLEISLANKTIVPNEHFLKLIKSFDSSTNREFFHYRRFNLLATLIEKSNDKEITSFLINLLKSFIKQAPEPQNSNEELIYTNMSTPLGKYLTLYLSILAKDNSLYDKKYLEFLSDEFNQLDCLKNRIFYYNWGRYYNWLENIEDYKVEKLKNENLKNALIEGLINHSGTLELYKKLKTDILKCFEQTSSKIVKDNIFYFLIYIKFALNEHQQFAFFEKRFKEKDKKDFWWKTLYPQREQKYNQNAIINYWKATINNHATFPQILLQVFNEYITIDTFAEYIEELIKLFKLYPSRDGSINMEYELSDFLENFVKFANSNNFKDADFIKVFNLINALIGIFKYYDYVSLTAAKHLLSILQKYYEYTNDKGNFNVLLEKILKTTNLIQYSDIFVEYKHLIDKC